MTTAQTTKRFPAIIMIATFCAVASACTTIYGAGLTNASLVGGPMTSRVKFRMRLSEAEISETAAAFGSYGVQDPPGREAATKR